MPTGEIRSRLGVRGRLLLAFFGISAFSALGAWVALYSFNQFDNALALITQRRIPAALLSQELSRHAERVVAAAPILLASTTSDEKVERSAAITSEFHVLSSLLTDFSSAGIASQDLASLEPYVVRLRENLDELNLLLVKRLGIAEEKKALSLKVVDLAGAVQKLLGPWISVMDERIAQWRKLAVDPTVHLDRREMADRRFETVLAWSQSLQQSQVIASGVSDMLLRVASTDGNDLTVISFRLRQSLNELKRLAQDLDPKLQPLVVELIDEFNPLVTGSKSIPVLRKTELDLISNATRLLGENAVLAKGLTATVDGLVAKAKSDITGASSDALSVVKLSTWVLFTAVVLSLASSILIVWLYVGRNLIARLTALSERMLTLAKGDLKSPLPDGGFDEIGRMAQALQVFRATAIEMEEANLKEIREARTRLTDAIETISEGFALYDADDKLVVCNRRYKDLFIDHADVIDPGTTFETIVRTAVERGLIEDANRDREAWLARRTTQHRAASSAHVQRRSDGRWIQVSERKTAAGGVVATYADITELKQRESELAASLDDLRTAQDRLVQTEKLASLGQLTGRHRARDQEPAQFRQQFLGAVRRTDRRTE